MPQQGQGGRGVGHQPLDAQAPRQARAAAFADQAAHVGAGVVAPAIQRGQGEVEVLHQQRANGEFGGEALGQRMQREQRALGLGQPAPGDELAQGPADPARQAGVGSAHPEAVVSGGGRQHRLDQSRGTVEIRRQGGFQRVGHLHGARLHFQTVQPVQRLPFEGRAVEPGPRAPQVLAAGSHQFGVDEVLEWFGHARTPGLGRTGCHAFA
jgi:hypothetical protein